MTLPMSDITSEIDYSSDSSNISENSDTSHDSNSAINKMYKRVSKHKIINNKYNSSSESIKKNIDNMSFEALNKNNNTTFYDMERISTIDFNVIYNLLILSTYVIFVDNNKLIKNKKNKCLKICSPRKVHLIDTEFPGYTFLPFESTTTIKKNLNKLNNSIFNSELNRVTLYINDNICNSIMFNEGEIIKNCLYKKMEITDTIMFIPIDIYNLKQTEYKLRGFCQIVEELGAKNIEITFKNTDINEQNKYINTKIGDDIELIAGNLGLSTKNTNENSTNYSYDLTYPTSSTILLNEKMIKNKIKKKKFIVSDSIFRSTLELQYLVNSRCRHLIDKYSTIFTFDNNNVIDKSMYLKLKTHGIEIGGSIKTFNSTKNNIQIITKVSFVSLKDCKLLINGNNVSLDEVGFNHIIETIRSDSNKEFETNGIYKIMNFINIYINTILKHNKNKHYDDIHHILLKIKKEITIEEYAKLLCNYFSQNSQWIHFTNFIDLLGKKTQSYDKLGFIIMTLQNNNIDTIIRFIQQTCVKNNIEDKFWKMLQPHNSSLKSDLENKLLIEYDFSNNCCWYNMNMLIQCIKLYTVNFSNDENEKLKQLITNMEVGYKYWEYYTNIVPFILLYARSLYYNTNDEIYLSSMFEKCINIDSFTASKINNVCDLKQFIEKKIKRIKEILEIKNKMEFPIDIIEFGRTFEKNNYVCKKIQYIMKNRTAYNIKKFLNCNDSIIRDILANDFIHKIICYDDKLDIKKIPKNYLGYQMVLDNYYNGINDEEFNKNIIPFLCNHYKNIKEVELIKKHLDIKNFNMFCSSYFEIMQYINKIIEENNI
jgi:hypothetical protein